MKKNYWLVVSTPLKNLKVSWDDYSQYMGNKKCSKPPTRLCRHSSPDHDTRHVIHESCTNQQKSGVYGFVQRMSLGGHWSRTVGEGKGNTGYHWINQGQFDTLIIRSTRYSIQSFPLPSLPRLKSIDGLSLAGLRPYQVYRNNGFICAMVKTSHMGDGHPCHIGDPYEGGWSCSSMGKQTMFWPWHICVYTCNCPWTSDQSFNLCACTGRSADGTYLQQTVST